MAGSNWVPEQRISSSHALSAGIPARYARSAIIARNIGDRQDPRLERDLVACNPLGIATPVETLVMGADPAGDVAQPGVLEDAGADLGVAHDLSPLRVVERSRLVQNRVGDPELAEIVEHAGGLDPLNPLGDQAERQRRLLGERTDRARVLRCVGVAHVEGLGEQHHRSQA